ncbi:hypothetical protein [Streptomyces marianii]|uniref:Uncharacterized protein n=1 Tax=Streptomyces marianii TaxID=1817406 RepID=A0A5R9E3T3_9ACTN|nr:hypothetical protein [Streptomyces marianii]TLQ44621.1 hypothetical protein FEF34_17265 [Streptomyces marianii]
MEHFAPVSVLALRHVLPHPQALKKGAGIRPLIDGRDVLQEIHPDGDSSCYQETWFGSPETWPLWAGDEPRRVELSNNDCDTGCCGGVFVTIQRFGDLVEWTNWENTNDNRVPVPPEIHFDATQYDAELARAVADHRWEEPVDTAARLLAHRIAASDWFERWNCQPFSHGIRVSDRGESPEVIMPFVTDGFGPGKGLRWYAMPVSMQEPVGDQVRRFVERITATDPRESAKGP